MSKRKLDPTNQQLEGTAAALPPADGIQVARSTRERRVSAPYVDPRIASIAEALERKRLELARKKAERDLTDKLTQVNVHKGQVLLSSERIWIIEGVADGRVSYRDELGVAHSAGASVVNKMLSTSALEPLDTSLRPIEVAVRAKNIFNLEPKAYYLQPILQPAMDEYLEKTWEKCSCAGQSLAPFELGSFTPSSLEFKTFFRELSEFATAGVGTAPVPFYVGKKDKNGGLFIVPKSVTVKKGGALMRQYSAACKATKKKASPFTLELECVFSVELI